MINYRLVAVPRLFWEQNIVFGSHEITIHTFVEDALGVERRIPKSVNLENERERYCLCCERIETAFTPAMCKITNNENTFSKVLQEERLPSVILPPDYLDILASLQFSRTDLPFSRIGASFFPPDMISPHLQAFEELISINGLTSNTTALARITFFKSALEADCGVIERQDAFILDSIQQSPPTYIPLHQLVEKPEPFTDIGDDFIDNSGASLVDILQEQIEKAIWAYDHEQPAVVNFSNQPHNVITEVLNRYVFLNTSAQLPQPAYVRVIYTDGSQGTPFPLRCLPRRTSSDRRLFDTAPSFHVALMSMRHQEMDRDVDMAWFRNREVSKTRTLGESDDFCYQHSKKQLSEIFNGGKLRFFLYQTGFQPAVVGFYRALVEEFQKQINQPPTLQVIPYYFSHKDGYVAGSLWT